MTVDLLWFMAIFAGVLATLLLSRYKHRLAALLVTSVAGVAYGLGHHGPLGLVLPLLTATVAAVQLFSLTIGDARAQLSSDEEAFLAGPLAGLGRAEARGFLDQGIWMQGEVGDALTREGQKVGRLYWIAEGAAEVWAHGQMVSHIAPGQLVGEATILSPEPATATVRLTRESRFWCAEAKPLNAYLAAHPHARHVLEHGFTISLKQKLDAMNRLVPASSEDRWAQQQQ